MRGIKITDFETGGTAYYTRSEYRLQIFSIILLGMMLGAGTVLLTQAFFL